MNKLKILLIEPPFYRLYNEKFSLNKYPLSLGYLASSIKKDTRHDVMVYNADFVSPSVKPTIAYMVNEGHTNYISNLNDLNFFIWKEIQDVIKSYNPDVVGSHQNPKIFRQQKM